VRTERDVRGEDNKNGKDNSQVRKGVVSVRNSTGGGKVRGEKHCRKGTKDERWYLHKKKAGKKGVRGVT